MRQKCNKLQWKKLTASIMMAVTAGFGVNTVSADNLIAVVSSTSGFGENDVGTMTGSRVTNDVDIDSVGYRIKNGDGDTAVFNFHHNGKSYLITRYGRTGVSKLSLAQGTWTAMRDGGMQITHKDNPNIHEVGYNDKFIYVTGYDNPNLSYAVLNGTGDLTNLVFKKAADYRENISHEGSLVPDYHGEGVKIRGNNLYALVTVNPRGGYESYDDSYLLRYKINEDGSLTYDKNKGSVRVGKNATEIIPYNNLLMTPAMGGMIVSGQADPNTALHVTDVSGGEMKVHKVKVPESTGIGKTIGYSNMQVTPEGNVYIVAMSYAGDFHGSKGGVYKTTVSNLLSDNPEEWTKITDFEKDNDGGYNWDVYAEENPRRVWVNSGNRIKLFIDGQETPISIPVRKFASQKDMDFVNMDGFTFLAPDKVTGEKENPARLLEISDDGVTLTGKDKAKYTYTKDTLIGPDADVAGDKKTNVAAAVFARDHGNLTLDAGTHTLTMNTDTGIGTPAGIYAANGAGVNVKAGKLNINTNSPQGGETKTSAIWLDPSKDKAGHIRIEAPVSIEMSGGEGGYGVAVKKTDRWGEKAAEAQDASDITIKGPLTIKGSTAAMPWGIGLNHKNVYGRLNNAGLYTAVDKSQITVDGPVDMAIYGNGATALAKDSLITLKGGKIEVPHGKNYAYYTLAAYGGSIYMNMGQDGKSEGNEKVELLGDVYTGKNGNIAIGLTTKDSLWKGIANSMGSVALSLKNGAVWTNEKQNTPYEDETEDIGSKGKTRLLRLTGGDSKDKAGIIFQKEKKGMNVENYSGYTQIIYDHDADLAFHAGSVTIESAKEGSSITVKTNNNGIDTGNEEITKKVLNNLAGKLVYENYKKGEKNLTGTVEIAEGITAQGVSVKLGAADFDAKTGVGTYGGQTPVTPPAPEEDERDDAPITESVTLKRDYTVNADKRDLSNGVIAGVYSNPKSLVPDSIKEMISLFNQGQQKFKEATEAGKAGNTELQKKLIEEANMLTAAFAKVKDSIIKMDIDAAYHDLVINSTVDKDTKADAVGIYSTTIPVLELLDAMKAEGQLSENEYNVAKSRLKNLEDMKIRGIKPSEFIKIRVKNEGEGNAYGITGNWAKTSNERAKLNLKANISMEVEAKNGDAVGVELKDRIHYNSTDKDGEIHIEKLKADNGHAIGYWIRGDRIQMMTGTPALIFGKDITSSEGSKGLYITGNQNNISPTKIYGGFDGNVVEMDASGSLNLRVADIDMTGHKGYAVVLKNGNLNVQGGLYKGNFLFEKSREDARLNGNITPTKWTGVLVNKAGKEANITVNLNTPNASVPNKDMQWTYEKIGGAFSEAEFTGTQISNLRGNKGNLLIRNEKPLEVTNLYNGTLNVFYAHDEKKPETIIGGDLIIHKAQQNSVINLYTDAQGITLTEKDSVNRVLDSLAHKLIYKEVTEEGGKKDNLTLLLGIKEGLTSQSVTKEMAVGKFKEEDGRGYLPETIETENPPLRVDKTLTENTEAVSDVDTALFNKGIISAISPAGKDLVIDMAGYDLIATARDTDKKPHMNVAAIYAGKGESVTIKNSKETGVVYLKPEKTSRGDVTNPQQGGNTNGILVGEDANVTIQAPVVFEGKYGQVSWGDTSPVQIAGKNSKVYINGLFTVREEPSQLAKFGNWLSVFHNYADYENSEIHVSDFSIKSRRSLSEGPRIYLGGGDYNLRDKDPYDVWTVKGEKEGKEAWDAFKTYEYTPDIDKDVQQQNGRIGSGVTINMNEDGTPGDKRVRLVGGMINTQSYIYEPASRIGLKGQDSYIVSLFDQRDRGDFRTRYVGGNEVYVQEGARLYTLGSLLLSDLHGGISQEKSGKVYIAEGKKGKASWVYANRYDGHMTVSMKRNTGVFLINAPENGSSVTVRSDVSSADWTNDALKKQMIYEVARNIKNHTAVYGTVLEGKLLFTDGGADDASVLHEEKLSFDAETGRGDIRNKFNTVADGKQPTAFYNSIKGGIQTDRKTGEITDEYLLSGVLVKPDWYEFRDNVEIKKKTRQRKKDPQTGKFMKDEEGHWIWEEVVIDSPKMIQVGEGRDVILDLNGHNFTGKGSLGGSQLADPAFCVDQGSFVTVKNPGRIEIDFQANETRGFFAVGIELKRNGESLYSEVNERVIKPTIHIANDNTEEHALTIRGDVKANNFDRSVRAVGIMIDAGEGNMVDKYKKIQIDGLVNIDINHGRGVWANAGKISMGGGKIYTPKNYAILALGIPCDPGNGDVTGGGPAASQDRYNDSFARGIVNVNVVADGDDLKAGINTVKIEGHIATNDLCSIGQWLLGNTYESGIVNVALNTKDSYWKGRAFSRTKAVFYSGIGYESKTDIEDNGKINLFLRNGATWTNDGEMEINEGYHKETDSSVNILQGGETDETKGMIYQKHPTKILIRSLRGHTLVYFDRDTEDKTKILGGDIEIGTAVRERNGELASMTLRTDSDGLNMTDEAEVNLVLDNLAKKLIYKGYKEGGRALEGKVEIAEGLTSASAQKSGYIKFDEKTGKGSFSKDKITYTESAFAPIRASRKLTENVSAESGDHDNVLFYNAALYNAGNDKMEVDLAGHALKLTSATTEVWGDGYINKVCDKVPTYFPAGVVGFKNTEIDVKDSSNGKGETHLNATGFEQQSVYGIVGEENSQVTMAGQTVVDKLVIQDHRIGAHYERAEAAAVLAKGKASRIHLDNLSMKKEATNHIYDYNPIVVERTKTKPGESAIKTELLNEKFAFGLVARGERSEITLGKADLELGGTVVKTEGKNSRVVVREGTLTGLTLRSQEVNPMFYRELNVVHTLEALDGTIYAGMNQDGNEAGDKTLNVTGNIMARANKGEQGIIHLGLGTKDSSWTGVTDYEYMNGEVNLYLKDGGTWTNERKGNVFEPYHYKGSILKTLKGGAAEKGKGYIIQNDEKPITAETYSGNTTVIYKHDKTDPKKMIGGDFIINKAEEGSAITLRTDNDGMNALSGKKEERNKVSEILNALANKLYYTAYKDGETNLKGKVEIAEGLTAQSASYRLEDMTFKKENGQGQYLFTPATEDIPDTPKPNPGTEDMPVIYGPKQTAMMRGAKSAMTTTMLSMRDNMTTMTQRLGDIHEGTEDGIWARTYGGKANYDKDLTKTKESFWGVQMGADKKQASGWHTGVSFDYQDGNATYELGGKGDPKLYTLGIYGTKVKDNGEYIDVVAKAGRGQNDYTVYNDMGHKLKGDYKANAMGLSVEYGKRIEKGDNYLTPQIQLSYMKLQGTDYDAISDYAGGKKMHVEQDGMTSLVGRIGIAAGKRTDKTDLYLKANLLHEFKGTTASTFSAENEPTGKVDQDFGDTWAEISIGVNHNIDKDKMIYADITKSFGGDYEMEWKANAGIRLRF